MNKQMKKAQAAAFKGGDSWGPRKDRKEFSKGARRREDKWSVEDQLDETNMNSLTEIIRNAIRIVEDGDVPEALEQSEIVRLALESRGLQEGCHVGKEDMTPEEVVEWYAGQFLEICSKKAWWGMNSFINCLDKFVPEDTSNNA